MSADIDNCYFVDSGARQFQERLPVHTDFLGLGAQHVRVLTFRHIPPSVPISDIAALFGRKPSKLVRPLLHKPQTPLWIKSALVPSSGRNPFVEQKVLSLQGLQRFNGTHQFRISQITVLGFILGPLLSKLQEVTDSWAQENTLPASEVIASQEDQSDSSISHEGEAVNAVRKRKKPSDRCWDPDCDSSELLRLSCAFPGGCTTRSHIRCAGYYNKKERQIAAWYCELHEQQGHRPDVRCDSWFKYNAAHRAPLGLPVSREQDKAGREQVVAKRDSKRRRVE